MVGRVVTQNSKSRLEASQVRACCVLMMFMMMLLLMFMQVLLL